MAICAHLPYELKEDLQRVASLNESTHPLTYELSRDQTEILERAKAKYRAVRTARVGRLSLHPLGNGDGRGELELRGDTLLFLRRRMNGLESLSKLRKRFL